jgi:hypothetical protein
MYAWKFDRVQVGSSKTDWVSTATISDDTHIS